MTLDITKEGLGLWIHDTASAIGNLHAIQDLGFNWIAAKFYDGLGGTNLYQPANLSQLLVGADSIGMYVVGWAYVYPGNPKVQAEAVADGAKKFGFKDIVLDMEVEWETSTGSADARAFLSALKIAAPGIRLHLSTFYALKMHPMFPYSTIITSCVSFMPQSYQKGDVTPADVWDTTIADFHAFTAPNSKPLVPTVGTPAMLETIAADKVNFKPACSCWLWDGDGINSGDQDLGVRGEESLWTPAIQAFAAACANHNLPVQGAASP